MEMTYLVVSAKAERVVEAKSGHADGISPHRAQDVESCLAEGEREGGGEGVCGGSIIYDLSWEGVTEIIPV